MNSVVTENNSENILIVWGNLLNKNGGSRNRKGRNRYSELLNRQVSVTDQSVNQLTTKRNSLQATFTLLQMSTTAFFTTKPRYSLKSPSRCNSREPAFTNN